MGAIDLLRAALRRRPFPPRLSVMAVVADDREQLFSFDEGDVLHVQKSLEQSIEHGGPSTPRVQLDGDGAVRPVVVWLPHTNAVTLLDARRRRPHAPRSLARTGCTTGARSASARRRTPRWASGR